MGLKRMRVFIFILLFPALCHGISRDDAVRYARDHAESVTIVKETARKIQAEGGSAAAFVKPRLELEAGYVEMGDNQPDIPISYLESPARDISAQIRLSQILYAGGRIRRSLELEQSLNAQADLVEISGVRDLDFQIRSAFDLYLYRKAALAILQDRVGQRETELEDAVDLRNVGMVTSLDVRQAKMSLNFAANALEEGKADLDQALIDFNTVMGRSASEKLLVPEDHLERIPDFTALMENLSGRFTKDRLIDIETYQEQVKASKLSYDIARGEGYPQVALFSSAKSNGERVDDMNESWNIGIEMTWTIFDGYLIKSKAAAARAEMKQNEEKLAMIRKNLAAKIEKLKINLKSLQQRILLQKEAVELSQKNYEDARGHYRAGTITLTRIGEFNLAYAEARFNLLSLFYLQRSQWIIADSLLGI